MGRPITEARAYQNLMASPLSEWRRGTLRIRCECAARGGPHRVAAAPVRDLERGRPGLTCGQWVRLLRCTVCGGRPGNVAIELPGNLWACLLGPGTPMQPLDEGPATERVEWWRGHPLLTGAG